MGSMCSRGSAVAESPAAAPGAPNGRTADSAASALPQESMSISESAMERPVFAGLDELPGPELARIPSQRPVQSKPKVSEMSFVIGKASNAGFSRAVDVLDTLGSSMPSLNISGGFMSGTAIRGNKITILAFEVANTIVKGCNLMQSLSEDNIRYLKEVVLASEGIQRLVSKDVDDLIKLIAADKREELSVFVKEVIRFGKLCKDPQWHSLERYFETFSSEKAQQNILKEEAEAVMQHLMNYVNFTAELYHELHTLDRFEQDYRRRHEEESKHGVAQKGIGDALQIAKQEVKNQRKHVKGLKKRSLWSKNLEEVIEKLVEIVHFLHLEMLNVFGSAGFPDCPEVSVRWHSRLGPAGLALHYANLITQIDTLVARSSSVPPSTRDNLYQGLPPGIKSSLRSKVHSLEVNEECSAAQIRAEMDKTLRWLVPLANNTTKAHHGFGWVGEWANTGSEVNGRPDGPNGLIRIETLHYADRDKTDAFILDLVVSLHHLISQSKGTAATNGGGRSPIKSSGLSPTGKRLTITLPESTPCSTSLLTPEDHAMLRDVKSRKFIPGISKSQEFRSTKPRRYVNRLSKSSSHSPISFSKREFSSRRPSLLPIINFEIDPVKALDVIDRVDDLRRF